MEPAPDANVRPCVRCGSAERYKDGRCKVCRIATAVAWQAANPERVRAKNAAWYAANSEKCKAKDAAWRAANPEREKARHAAWRAANPEREKATDAAKWTRIKSALAELKHLKTERLFNG